MCAVVFLLRLSVVFYFMHFVSYIAMLCWCQSSASVQHQPSFAVQKTVQCEIVLCTFVIPKTRNKRKRTKAFSITSLVAFSTSYFFKLGK